MKEYFVSLKPNVGYGQMWGVAKIGSSQWGQIGMGKKEFEKWPVKLYLNRYLTTQP